MTLICERCFGPIDPEHERYYRLAHLSHAEPSGDLVWNEATVHTAPCLPAQRYAREPGRDRRAA